MLLKIGFVGLCLRDNEKLKLVALYAYLEHITYLAGLPVIEQYWKSGKY